MARSHVGGRKGGGSDGHRLAREGARYWSDHPTSRGKVAGIGWAPHSGAWRRCVARVSKHLGEGAKGYCNKRMHDALGIWAGSAANRGKSGKGKSKG